MRGVQTSSLWQLNILWELQALGALVALYRQTSISVRDVWETLEPSTYSQVTKSMLMGSRWSVLAASAILVTCLVLVVDASLQ